MSTEDDRKRAAQEAAFINTRVNLALMNAAALAVNFGGKLEDFVGAAEDAFAAMTVELQRMQAQILTKAP